MKIPAGRMIGAAGVAALGVGVIAGMMLGRAKRTAVKAHMALNHDWERQLRSEHRAVKAMLRAMVDTEAGDAVKRKALLEGVADALTRHAVEEENVIYPALSRAGLEDSAAELYAEHAEMKIIVGEMKSLEAEDPAWLERARALKTLIYAHVREEETSLFPMLRQAEPKAEAKVITRQMAHEGLRATG
jgi:hemerythrin-like domain-containing protein